MPVELTPAPGGTPLAGDTQPTARPLYQQIKALLVAGLHAGEWKPGALIPSEVDLAARFGVSQGTVRKAIDELAAENLVTRRQGRGTFVATHAEQQVQFRFLRVVPDVGEPTGIERRFLDCRTRPAPPAAAHALGLAVDTPLVWLRRLLARGGTPVVLEDIWLPAAPFAGLTAERLARCEGPMYGFFEHEFGVRMIRAEEQLRAVPANAETAQLLQVSVGAALLSVERIAYTYGDQPVEWRCGCYDTRTHHYRNDLF